jgi:hypothetical protein
MKFRLRVSTLNIRIEKDLAQNIMNKTRVNHINKRISNERCFSELTAQDEAMDYLLTLEKWLVVSTIGQGSL